MLLKVNKTAEVFQSDNFLKKIIFKTNSFENKNSRKSVETGRFFERLSLSMIGLKVLDT